jgi:hypothetical protein
MDHLAKVLEEKDAHSLWMLLKRSGIQMGGFKKAMGPINIKTCTAIIEEMGQEADYKATMTEWLKKLNAPRDWNEYNAKLVAEFKKKYPAPRGQYRETKYYHILSTCSKELTDQLVQHMDAVVAQVYHKIFEFEEKIPYKYVIRFWKDRNEFGNNGGPPMAAAYFKPDTKELVGYNLRADGRSLQDPFQTLSHEGWHQFFDFFIPDAPRWYDEGFAEVIYPTTVKNGKANWSGFNLYRSQDVTQALKANKLIPLRDVIRMSHGEAYSGDVGLFYAEAWSFVYFLTTYTHSDKKIQQKVRNFYKDYFWELHKGTDFVEAVDIVFKEVNFETLEAAWLKAIPHQK